MMDVLSLRRDSDFQTKTNILTQLQNEGFIDQLRAQLRSQVIKAMEQEKKKAYGTASKYLQHSELSNPVTKKVVSHQDGLLCAEIIREFLNFYKMNLSLQVFVPEMSLSSSFPKTRSEMEREIGVFEMGDTQKPLLLKLIEQIKYGDPVTVKKSNADNPNSWASTFDEPKNYEDPFKKPVQQQNDVKIEVKPEKADKKKKSNKKKDPKSKKDKSAAKKETEKESVSSLAKLDDLPSLMGPKKVQAPLIKDDYDFNLDDDEDDDNNKEQDRFESKYSKIENMLEDQREEEKKGFKMRVNAPPKVQNQKHMQHDDDEDSIEEEIQSEQDNYQYGKDGKLGESSGAGSARGFGVTVSQSLGIDKSVDSLALDDYDHIEFID